MSKQIKNKLHKLLLDTHVWIWVGTNNTKRLSPAFVRNYIQFQKASHILLSPISFWEIGMLVQKGRLKLEIDCLEWVKLATQAQGLRVAPITPKIAVNSSRLPGTIHGDPVDRLLISTAMEQNAILATADEKLIAYCKQHHIPYIAPR